MERLPRLLQRMEARQGIVCYSCVLVSLVCQKSCPRMASWTDTSSDIAFYGINLNQSVVLTKIGFAKGATPWETLYKTAVGNIIVQAAVSYYMPLLRSHR